MAWRKVPFVVPAEPVKPRRLFDFVTGLRSSQGVRFVSAERGVMFSLVKSLRRNEVLGLAVDRDWRGDGVPLEWCGATATFQAAPPFSRGDWVRRSCQLLPFADPTTRRRCLLSPRLL